MSIRNPKPRTLDITDTKWSHPELVQGWPNPDAWPAATQEQVDAVRAGDIDGINPYSIMVSELLTLEEKAAFFKAADWSVMDARYDATGVTFAEYDVPGCEYEPDAPVHVVVATPDALTKKRNRCIFYLMGGAMLMNYPGTYPIAQIAREHNAVVVVPVYRISALGQYPAAINDCHAAFSWMIEHADELRINPKRVVLNGLSTGGHLATALPFRLMRHGFEVRGVVADVPIVDDRSIGESTVFANGTWDGDALRRDYRNWMGEGFAKASVGPEAFANHATVDDCIGYPPLFMHTGEFDPNRDATLEFTQKVQAAHSFCEYHIWGGRHHGLLGVSSPEADLINQVVSKNIEDCFEYDLSRPWVEE